MTTRKTYDGPTIFSHGFRPFFLAAGVFAAGVIPIWMLMFSGHISPNLPFPAIDWHIHEMLFGYGAMVVSGFLFTAVPNWTGRMPIRGKSLIGLLVLWLAGRLAMAGMLPFAPIWVMLVDCGFLAAIVISIAIEIVAGRNWRNLIVLIPVSALLCANVLFHVEVMTQGSSNYARRLGIGVLIFLIMLIGGRIVPSFTRNWLAKNNPGALPQPFNRYDGICLILGAVALGLWVVYPFALVTRGTLVFGSGVHLVRLARWQGVRTLRSPLLAMLHLSYLFIPIGLIAAALAASSVGVHLLGIGAIGGMTVAVMMRATLGHTGRSLEAGKVLTVSYILIVTSALIRGFGADVSVLGISGLWIAAILWMLGFAGFVTRVGPWFFGPNQA